MTANHYDVIVVGTGPGGASVAFGLARSGARVLMLERGDYLPAEPQNWDSSAVFSQHKYKSGEQWWDARRSRAFRAGVHYWVGGNTKMYGAALTRPRRADFEEFSFPDGRSPKWPIGYDDLSPFYSQAEELFRVHGDLGEDPGEPEHSSSYPFKAVPHEPYVARLASDFAKQGLRPTHLPMGIDLRPGGTCVYCATCDGFPCRVRAKSDAETCLVKPALTHKGVSLLTNAFVTRLKTRPGGRSVESVQCNVQGEAIEFTADVFVVGCGAINSAALLLRSANEDHPNGLANRSGLVGRNYMKHNSAVVLGLDPRRPNTSVFQKTLVLNDWYSAGERTSVPLGSAQLVGKMQSSMLKDAVPLLPDFAARWIASHTHEWWLLTEDLPNPNNQVKLGADGSIQNSLYAQQQGSAPSIGQEPQNGVAEGRISSRLRAIPGRRGQLSPSRNRTVRTRPQFIRYSIRGAGRMRSRISMSWMLRSSRHILQWDLRSPSLLKVSGWHNILRHRPDMRNVLDSTAGLSSNL